MRGGWGSARVEVGLGDVEEMSPKVEGGEGRLAIRSGEEGELGRARLRTRRLERVCRGL